MATAVYVTAVRAALRQQLTCRVRQCVRPLGAQLHSKNPFEIHFHSDDEELLRVRKPQHTPSAATEKEVALQDDIRLLHAEMADIFGEELEEYDDSSSSNSNGGDTASSSESQNDRAWDAVPVSTASAAALLNSSVKANCLSSTTPGSASSHAATGQRSLASAPTLSYRVRSSIAGEPSILVLQGPCSYLRGVSASTNKPKHKLLEDVHRTAAQLGTTVDCRDSNLEGEILEWLLSAEPGSTIVLCWNARLSDSPMVVRALALLDAVVIVVSPLGVEHGALPACVRGVISGVDATNLELALRAADALRSSGSV